MNWAKDEAFLLVATLARADLRDDSTYEARHDPLAGLHFSLDPKEVPREGTALAEAVRWASVAGLDAAVAGILAALRDRMRETDDEYCNRAEAVAAAIQARAHADRAASDRAERRKAAQTLLWLCHEVLRRVREAPVADVASVVGSCAGSMVHHAREAGLSAWGEHEGPIECFAWVRDGKDVPPTVRWDFDRNPNLQAMFLTELREPFEGASQFLTGWLEGATDAKRIVPDMKHGDLAAFRDGVLRVLPRYIRFLESKRFAGLLSKEEIAACAGPPPDGTVLPLRRRAPGEEPYRESAPVETPAPGLPPAVSPASTSPTKAPPAPSGASREPIPNSAEGRALKELRKAKGAFVAGIRGEIVRRLREKGHRIESATEARQRDEGVQPDAKGYRLHK